MEKTLSADYECVFQGGGRDDDGHLIPSVAGVVLRGMGESAVLSVDEARGLAMKWESKWPDLAKQLDEAASGVRHFTRFDGPLGLCDEAEARPGDYEKAEGMISKLEDA